MNAASLSHEFASPRSAIRAVLLVDDEEPIRKLLALVLRQAGYEVVEASDGLEALDAAKEHLGRIDLILTDVVMPRLGGPELCARLKRDHPETLVLLMSGCVKESLPPKYPFLQKPFAPSTLLRAVSSLLNDRSADFRLSDSAIPPK